MKTLVILKLGFIIVMLTLLTANLVLSHLHEARMNHLRYQHIMQTAAIAYNYGRLYELNRDRNNAPVTFEQLTNMLALNYRKFYPENK